MPTNFMDIFMLLCFPLVLGYLFVMFVIVVYCDYFDDFFLVLRSDSFIPATTLLWLWAGLFQWRCAAALKNTCKLIVSYF